MEWGDAPFGGLDHHIFGPVRLLAKLINARERKWSEIISSIAVNRLMNCRRFCSSEPAIPLGHEALPSVRLFQNRVAPEHCCILHICGAVLGSSNCQTRHSRI